MRARRERKRQNGYRYIDVISCSDGDRRLASGGSILYTAKLDRSTIVILWALELKLDVDLACDGHEYAAFACRSINASDGEPPPTIANIPKIMGDFFSARDQNGWVEGVHMHTWCNPRRSGARKHAHPTAQTQPVLCSALPLCARVAPAQRQTCCVR